MVRTNMDVNVNKISQKSEHMWQAPLCVVPFEIQKPGIKHTHKISRHITTHGHTYTYKKQDYGSEAF